jgi:hypothetical protein
MSDQLQWVGGVQTDWDNIQVDMNTNFGGDAFMDPSFAIPDTFKPSLPSSDLWTQEVTNLDLQDPLPPAKMVNDL